MRGAGMVARSVRRGAVLVPDAATRAEVLSRMARRCDGVRPARHQSAPFCALGAEAHWLGVGGALSGALRLLLRLTYNFLYGPGEVHD
jgi:hypothetical protein